MNDKEFRKLRRKDLIEIIYQYQCREQELLRENEALRKGLQDHSAEIQPIESTEDAFRALDTILGSVQNEVGRYLKEIQHMQKVFAEKLSENAEASTLAEVTLPKEPEPQHQTISRHLHR